MKTKITILCLALFAIVSCRPASDGDAAEMSAFAKKSVCGVYEGSEPLFVYDLNVHQTSLSAIPKYAYRLQTDAQDVYMAVEVEVLPTKIEQGTTISVDAVGVKSLKAGSYNVVLVKSANNMLWLWDKDNRLGFLIPAS